MEATGVYYRPLAYALHRAGFAVYVVNPLQVRAYARSLLTRNKTDKADARLLARFLAQYRADLTPYEPLPEALYLASLLVRFAEGLNTQRTASLNRLHAWRYAHPHVHELALSVPDSIQSLRAALYAEAQDPRAKALGLLGRSAALPLGKGLRGLHRAYSAHLPIWRDGR